MKTLPKSSAWVCVLAMAMAPLQALAQANAPLPDTAPSAAAPIRIKPAPRLLTPTESRDSATLPGDVRAERPVTPQISIPFGKTPAAPFKSEERAKPVGGAAASTRHDEEAARCETLVGEQVRAKCRDALSRETRGR